jgi:hypothetical protein
LNRTLFDLLEDKEADLARAIEQHRHILQLERTKIPPVMATIKAHFLNANEFELFEFMDNCEWWNAKIHKAVGVVDDKYVIAIDFPIKDMMAGEPIMTPPNTDLIWFRTAAVRVTGKGIVEFMYDDEYIEEEAKVPGKLAYLMAHELSHILRFHADRTEKQNKDHSLSNSAQDMIINHDIDNTPQIGGWKPVPDKGDLKVPEKFHKDFEKIGKKAYYFENMYNWLLINKPKEQEGKEGKSGKGTPPPMDYYKEGQLVKVNSGKHKDEYRKITKVNPDGTFETEEVDIAEEIKKARGA